MVNHGKTENPLNFTHLLDLLRPVVDLRNHQSSKPKKPIQNPKQQPPFKEPNQYVELITNPKKTKIPPPPKKKTPPILPPPRRFCCFSHHWEAFSAALIALLNTMALTEGRSRGVCDRSVDLHLSLGVKHGGSVWAKKSLFGFLWFKGFLLFLFLIKCFFRISMVCIAVSRRAFWMTNTLTESDVMVGGYLTRNPRHASKTTRSKKAPNFSEFSETSSSRICFLEKTTQTYKLSNCQKQIICSSDKANVGLQKITHENMAKKYGVIFGTLGTKFTTTSPKPIVCSYQKTPPSPHRRL